jgi:hypothetical protein
VFTYIHEIFFGEFPIILIEWLERVVENIGRYRVEALRNWTRELIIQLNKISNKVSHTVDFWLNSILRGYIIEFVVDCTQSYSVVERGFFKGPCIRYLSVLSTWINILLCDKNVMNMESDI